MRAKSVKLLLLSPSVFLLYRYSFFSEEKQKISEAKHNSRASRFFLREAGVLSSQEQQQQQQQQQQIQQQAQNMIVDILKKIMAALGSFAWQFAYQLFKMPIEIALQIFHLVTLYKYKARKSYATPGGLLAESNRLAFRVQPPTARNQALKIEL